MDTILVKALGSVRENHLQISQVSRNPCGELSSQLIVVKVQLPVDRPLDGGPYCYLWLDALSQKRQGGRKRIVNVERGCSDRGLNHRTCHRKGASIGMDVGT